jgi:hypothetical protein
MATMSISQSNGRPLIIAVQENNMDIFRFLLRSGADIYYDKETGWTEFRFAATGN